MRRLLVYILHDGRIATCLRTIDQQNGRVVDRWFTYAEGEAVFVGEPPLDQIGLIRTINISNEP